MMDRNLVTRCRERTCCRVSGWLEHLVCAYGGPPFNITIPASSYSGSVNTAAASATCVILRGGSTTHAMNMGQRFLQLNNTFTVGSDGSIILHVAQVPPNPNLFQPVFAFMFVNVRGIPSNGSYLIVGNGQICTQPTLPSSVLPPNVLSSASGTASGSDSTGMTSGNDIDGSQSKLNLGIIIGSVVGGFAIQAILGALGVVCNGAFIGIFKGEEANLDSKKNVPFQRDQLLKTFEVIGTPDGEVLNCIAFLYVSETPF
jgi:galactose oxidase-like protein